MKRKKYFQILIFLILVIFYYSSEAQQMVQVSRWVSPVIGDFVSIPSNKGTDAQISNWGYTNKIYQYDAYLSKPPGENIAIVNRWVIPNCKEFVTIAEHEHTDQQLISWGYTDKELLFYAYMTKPDTGNYIAVNRWINAKPKGDKCKDFTLSVTDKELSDDQLISWGYTSKMKQFYVPVKINYISIDGATLAKALVQSKNKSLNGWADMHTHPMSHLGFGGKLIHGAPDVGILVPAIPSGDGCRHYERASNIDEAIGTCRATHGGVGVSFLGIGEGNTCGDDLRKIILRATESNLHSRTGHHEEGSRGFPTFSGWPAHSDITHQQMWIDWIKRTYQNGLRVMVALTVNNYTLAAAVSGTGDRNPDDVSSSNIQIDEMKRLVARHNGSEGSVDNWMEIAYSSIDIRRIVRSNRLAVILGMEVDNIGNFNKNNLVNPNNLTPSTILTVRNEIQRVFDQGVRYVFPIHLVDNKFGGTAVYEDMFNLSNYHQTGRFWDIICASPLDGITKKFVVAGFNAPLAAAKVKMGIDFLRNPPPPPNCEGHVNNLGLTPLGEFAIKEMMKLGMMLDIDHMSKKSMDRTLQIALSVTSGGYPLNAGHNGIRGNSGSERSLNVTQAQSIMQLGGIIGVGCSKASASDFTQNFTNILSALGVENARLAIGTDINGFEQGPPPRAGSMVQYTDDFPICQTGTATWDYNKVGVAHYGLLPDFLRDVNSLSPLRIFDNHLMKSAEYFAQMWEKCERQKSNIRN